MCRRNLAVSRSYTNRLHDGNPNQSGLETGVLKLKLFSMKKIFLLFLIIISVAAIHSCKKENPVYNVVTTPPPSPPPSAINLSLVPAGTLSNL